MLVQFNIEITHGEVKLPPCFTATHWRKVAKTSTTVDVGFPIDVTMEIKFSRKSTRDHRLVFDEPILKTLHLKNGDRLIFQYDNAQRPILLNVVAMYNEWQMAMVDTRLSRAYNCFIHQIPLEYANYVDNIIYVESDGHCGFYCVLEEGGAAVAKDVAELRNMAFKELNDNYDHYRTSMGLVEDFQKPDFDAYIADVLTEWMDVSLAGVLSTVIGIPILMLVEGGTCLYVPQRNTPEEAKGPLICMAHINGDHYVRVKLTPNCTLPGVNGYRLPDNKNSQWEQKRKEGLLAMLALGPLDLGNRVDDNNASYLADGGIEGGCDNLVEEGKNEGGCDDLVEGGKNEGAVKVEGKQRIDVEQPPQRQRRRNFAPIPEKRELRNRERNKPKTYMMESFEANCWKPKEKKRKGKKKMSEMSECSSRTVKPKNDTMNRFDSENQRGRLVKPRDDGITSKFFIADDDMGRSSSEEIECSDFKKEKNKPFDKNLKEKQQRSEEDSGSVATTKSERSRIKDTIQPMIIQLREFVLPDEEEMEALDNPQELIKKKGKKGRNLKAKWIILMLQSFFT